jgi:hypothetical protein
MQRFFDPLARGARETGGEIGQSEDDEHNKQVLGKLAQERFRISYENE